MPIDFSKSKYGEKARSFLRTSILDMPLLTLLCGSVRSGKTINIIYKMPQILNEIGNEYLKVFSGYSKATVRNNVLIELIPYLENYHGAKVKYNSGSGEMDIHLWGKTYNCLVVGAGKSDSYAGIQGGTWDFWYANELPQHHYAFYNMALSRLTPAQARAVADANPESTNHWLYQEKIEPFLKGDEEVKKVFNYWHFIMDDNLNLSETFIENQKRLYTGAFYERKILGQWVIAEGLVYDTFSKDKHLCHKSDIFRMIENNEFIDFFCGIDHGYIHPASVVLFGVTKQGNYYIIESIKQEKFEHEDIIKWIRQKQTEYGIFVRYVNADNARPEQNAKIREWFNTYEIKPKVEDSIAICRNIINFDRLTICEETNRDLLQELYTYRYPSKDEQLKMNPESWDKPIKEFDDAMDAMRYGLWFYEAHYGQMFK